MRYLPHTPDEIRDMLSVIGVPSVDALFEPVPREVQLGRPLAIEPSLDEASLMDEMDRLAQKNSAVGKLSFLGAGIYDHHVPPAVDQLLLRSEFYTAYTPYQAEVAQGTLQAIFEFQTLVCELFGMPVANASMYDGASASAEAVLMARRLTKRSRVLVSEGVHPEYFETIRTYLRGLPGGVETISRVPLDAQGMTDRSKLDALLGEDVACVIVGYPNFYGVVEDLRPMAEAVSKKGALLVTATAEPYALAVVEPPGAAGAHIAVGEGQALGVPPQNGGPGCGLFACLDGRDYLQSIPGRLVGKTVDKNGTPGYVLTLSTREQHIRRERATSNICTNHSLCALAVAIRMCLLGRRGFVEVSEQCLSKAEYLRKKLVGSGTWEASYSGPTFNEFLLRLKKGSLEAVLRKAEAEGVLAGVPLARFDSARTQELLIAVTERHKREDLDRLATVLTS